MYFNCIRDVLIAVKSAVSKNGFLDAGYIGIDNLQEFLQGKEYSPEMIANVLVDLSENDYIQAEIAYADDIVQDIMISGLTPSGYHLYELIRPKTTWEKILPYLKQMGSNFLCNFPGFVESIMGRLNL